MFTPLNIIGIKYLRVQEVDGSVHYEKVIEKKSLIPLVLMRMASL